MTGAIDTTIEKSHCRGQDESTEIINFEVSNGLLGG